MKFSYSVTTHPGKVRSRNEDTYIADSSIGLFLVADGMGGHSRGDEASTTAAVTVHEVIKKGMLIVLKYQQDKSKKNRNAIFQLLREAIKQANKAVLNKSRRYHPREIMGTTMTGMLLVGGSAFVFHVGDSRLYLLREDKIHLITPDDSLFFQLIRLGATTKEKEKRFPFKNIMTKAVGVREDIEPLILDLPLLKGDRLLISSDGLHGYFPDKDLQIFLSQDNIENALKLLVGGALNAGGEDNITGIIVQIDDIEEEEQKEQINIYTILEEEQLFTSLTLSELVRIFAVSDIIYAKDGEYIFKQGEKSDSFYLVLKGNVLITRDNEIVASITKGEHFGELSLASVGIRLASGIAKGDTTLLRLKRDRFIGLIHKDPIIGLKLLWNLSMILGMKARSINDELSLLKAMIEHNKLKIPTILDSDELEVIDEED